MVEAYQVCISHVGTLLVAWSNQYVEKFIHSFIHRWGNICCSGRNFFVIRNGMHKQITEPKCLFLLVASWQMFRLWLECRICWLLCTCRVSHLAENFRRACSCEESFNGFRHCRSQTMNTEGFAGAARLQVIQNNRRTVTSLWSVALYLSLSKHSPSTSQTCYSSFWERPRTLVSLVGVLRVVGLDLGLCRVTRVQRQLLMKRVFCLE